MLVIIAVSGNQYSCDASTLLHEAGQSCLFAQSTALQCSVRCQHEVQRYTTSLLQINSYRLRYSLCQHATLTRRQVTVASRPSGENRDRLLDSPARMQGSFVAAVQLALPELLHTPAGDISISSFFVTGGAHTFGEQHEVARSFLSPRAGEVIRLGCRRSRANYPLVTCVKARGRCELLRALRETRNGLRTQSTCCATPERKLPHNIDPL